MDKERKSSGLSVPKEVARYGREGHIPMFPSYIPKNFPDRRLFYYDHNRFCLVDEDNVSYPVGSLDDLRNILFDNNGLCFVRSFTDEGLFPFLADLVRSPDCSVLCTRRGAPVGARLSKGRRTRWLALRRTWDDTQAEIDQSFLKNMRQLYEYCGVGVVATPGALGTQLWRKSYKEHKLKSHTSVNGYAESFIRSNMTGGRVDTPGLGKFYDSALELDRASAYLKETYEKPDGTSIIFRNGPSSQMVTWFARCEIEVPWELALGPFPVRREDRVVYPTLKGKYDAYIWREQAESAERAGCKIRPREGVGWKTWTQDNSWWCESTYQLKCSSPTEFIESKIKGAIVAAIGRLAMTDLKYVLVPEEEATVFDIPVCGEGVAYAFFIHEEQIPNYGSMIHWNGHTMQGAAMELYDFALPYAEQGRLIASNYDSVLVIEGDESRQYVKKYSAEAIYCRPGTWRWERLHDVLVVAPRSIICNEKVVLPGIPRKERANATTGV